MHVAFHVNPSQAHQREHAQWFKDCITDLTITDDINLSADIHIVSGPHYAKQRWIGHPRVLLLDRAYLPEHQVKSKWVSEDWVSLGWMTENGGRIFKSGIGRPPVIPKDRRTGSGTIFLADYAGPVEQADTVRLHPSRESNPESLLDALSRHSRAIGYSTTALVTAYLEGLEVISRDPEHILNQGPELLPYADWHYSEIQSGEAWEHLCQQL